MYIYIYVYIYTTWVLRPLLIASPANFFKPHFGTLS